MYNVKQWMGAGVGNVNLSIDPEGFLNETVLASDALLPVQLYGTRRGSAALEPLKRLMMAILVDAIRCYHRNFEAVTPHKRREFREAQDWLFKDRNDGPFAFDTVCYVPTLILTSFAGVSFNSNTRALRLWGVNE